MKFLSNNKTRLRHNLLSQPHITNWQQMSELKVRLYQASFNPSHPCRGAPTQRISLGRNSTNNASWGWDNENNFFKLYFCPTLVVIFYRDFLVSQEIILNVFPTVYSIKSIIIYIMRCCNIIDLPSKISSCFGLSSIKQSAFTIFFLPQNTKC